MTKVKSKEEEVLEFAKKRKEWREDPISFYKEVLGMTLPYHQKKLLQECAKRNKISIKSGNSLGKCGIEDDYTVLADGTIVKNKYLIDKEFEILSYDPEKDIQLSKNAKGSDNGARECISITLQSGTTITRTTNHPLFKGKIKNELIYPDTWCEVENLQVGNYILVPKVHNIKPTRFDLTDEQCIALGKSIYNSKFPELNYIGQLPLRQISLIIKSIFSSCENININAKGCNISISLTNYETLKQLILLLKRFEIDANCFKHDKGVWALSINSNSSIIKFCEQIGIFEKEEVLDKCIKYARLKNSKKENEFIYTNCPDGFMWEKIVDIKNVGLKSTVCIEVEDTHTYLTEVYDHNSHCIGALAFHFFFTRITDDPNDTCIVIITAPTFPQIKHSIFANIKMFAEQADRYVKNKFGPEYSFLSKNFSESANVCEYHYNSKCFITGIATGEGNEGAGNTLSGRHATHVLVIADEAQGVSEGTFSSFKGILSGGNETKYILLGNTTLPNGASGTFYESFEENSDFKNMTITAFDSPNFVEPKITLEDMLAPDCAPNNWRKKLDKYCGTDYVKAVRSDEVDAWENEVKKKLPLSAIANPIGVYSILKECGFNTEQYEFKTRVLAEFPTSGGKTVIDSKLLDDSFTNYFLPECIDDDDTTVMGVDIASGLGRDFSTICIRRGNKVIFLDEFQLKAPDLEQKIRELYQEYGCLYCNLERDGLGVTIYEHLIENDDICVLPIVSGGSPGVENPMTYEEEENNKELKRQYHCNRDYLWFNLSNLLNPYYCNQHGKKTILLPRNNKLKKQLIAPTWKYSSTNKRQVESKEIIRKKLGSSTDLADAVIFAFAPISEADHMMFQSYDFSTFKHDSWD